MRIAILAYGSLINDPGQVLEELIIEKRAGIRTPFRVEFARSSQNRGGAPTLVPVTSGGAHVEAMLLCLRQGTKLEEARKNLYQRESGQDRPYVPDPTKLNQVYVELLMDWHSFDYVLYTRIADNIRFGDRTPHHLASLAIASAQNKDVKDGEDGISYLIAATKAGVKTSLSEGYAAEILELTKTRDLEAALDYCRPSAGLLSKKNENED